MSVLCEVLRDRKTPTSLKIALDILLRGHPEAPFTVYLIAKYGIKKSTTNLPTANEKHVDALLSFTADPQRWAIEAMGALCKLQPNLAEIVKNRALTTSGILRASLLYTADKRQVDAVFEAFESLLLLNDADRDRQPLHLLQTFDDVDWREHKKLFLDLLRTKHRALARHLLESQYPTSTLSNLDIGAVQWWCEWLSDTRSTEQDWWLRHRLSHLFAVAITGNAKEAFVAEFNKKSAMYRPILAQTILLARNDITTDSFTEETIDFLIADLARPRAWHPVDGHLLGRTATETFVIDRLLPLLSAASSDLKDNLLHVLDDAGNRHGRRYVPS